MVQKSAAKKKKAGGAFSFGGVTSGFGVKNADAAAPAKPAEKKAGGAFSFGGGASGFGVKSADTWGM